MSELNLLGLPARTIMVLERAGITKVEQLCQMKSWRVLAIPGLGKVSYKQIAKGMTALGFHFEDHESKHSPSISFRAPEMPSMSLRDYFAAKALQGMTANPYLDDYEFDTVAEMAYAQADEMLTARVKP